MKFGKSSIVVAILSLTFFACKKKNENQTVLDNEIIQKYLKDNSLVADTTRGIYYIISDTGTVNHPTATSIVSVYYKGYLTDGTTFDQSIPGLPREFPLQGVIKGWQIGVPLIGKGGKIKLLIPSALGYGASKTGAIPANSVLIFDIELSTFR